MQQDVLGQLKDLKVPELREYLKKLNLDSTGTKDNLIPRLFAYCSTHNVKSISALDSHLSSESFDDMHTESEEVLTSPQKVRVVTKSKSEKGVMTWEVHQFSSLSVAPGEKIKSSVFVVGKRKWQVHLYPCGDKDDKEHVTCYLHYLEDHEEETTARWKAKFSTKSGDSLRPPLELQFSFGKIKSRGWRGILVRKANFLGTDDVLIVESDLEVFGEWITTDNILSTTIPTEEFDPKQSVLKDFGKLRNNEELFSDVAFIVDGVRFPAHKNILSARSPFFKAMFTGGMRESTEQTIQIHDTDRQIFEQMLKFIYCGECDDNVLQDKTVDLLAVADRYDLQGLKHKCETLLLQRVTKSTAATILIVADTYHATSLKKNLINVITQHFFEIIGTDAFKELCIKAPPLMAEITDVMAAQRNSSASQNATSVTSDSQQQHPGKRKRDG